MWIAYVHQNLDLLPMTLYQNLDLLPMTLYQNLDLLSMLFCIERLHLMEEHACQ